MIFESKGQAMLLTTVMIGGVFLLATSIAGLLMFYQLQQSTDAGNSTIAIYAADAALEKAIYEYFNDSYFVYDPNPISGSVVRCPYPSPCLQKPSVALSNGAAAEAELVIPPPTVADAKTIITASGRDASKRTVRLLQTTFLVTPSR